MITVNITNLLFYTIIGLLLLISLLVGIRLGLLIKNKLQSKNHLSEEFFNRYYDACFAALKDMIRHKETFNSFSDLIDSIKKYHMELFFKDNFEKMDECIKDILVFGVVAYIVKEHNLEHKLIINSDMINEIISNRYHRAVPTQDSGTIDPVYERFNQKVVAHSKDYYNMMDRESKKKLDRISQIKNESDSMMPTIDNFYEE